MAESTEMNPNQNVSKGCKKRTRKPEEWQREKRKRLRVAGKEYVNTRGDLINGRTIGEDCKCRRKCFVNVSEEVRSQLFEGYYSLKSHDEQNAYLFGLIRKQDVARKRSKESVRRTCTYTYFVRNRGKETQVCRLAFAHIHGISSPKIRNLCLKLDMNVMFPRDGRGKHDHRPKKISAEKIQHVRQHINCIIRSDQVQDFIKEEKNCGPDVNITKMWKDYLKRFETNINLETVSSKPQRSDSKHKTRHGCHGSLHSQSHSVLIGATLQDHSDHGLSHLNARNLNTQEQQRNCLSLVNYDKINSSDCKGSLSDDESEEGEQTTKIILPIVKHWLYSKIFHEEVKAQDILALRKKLWDVKRGEHKPGTVSLNSRLITLRACSSKQPAIKALLKSDRKQRVLRKMSKGKAQNFSVNDTLNADSGFCAKHHCEMPVQTNPDPNTQEVYLVPLQIQEVHQQTSHTSFMTIDLMTSQPSYLSRPPTHQHLAEAQHHLHTFPAVLKDHLAVGGQGTDDGQQSITSSSVLSPDTTQKYCNFINVNNTPFY